MNKFLNLNGLSILWNRIKSIFLTKLDAQSTYAKLASANNLMHSESEFTFAKLGYVGDCWINYRTSDGSNGEIAYMLGNGTGGGQQI